MDTLDARPLPGGPLAIDLLNTAWSVDDSEVDWFDNDDAVYTFATAHSHAVSNEGLQTTRDSLIGIRRIIRRLFSEASIGQISGEVVDDVNAVLSRSQTLFAVTPDGPTMSVDSADSTHSLSVKAIVDAVDLLKERSGRLRICGDENCTLWFVDISKAGRRRWCSMELCGNRTKARRHYKRAHPKHS